jgi:hypothetical protein
MPLRDQKSIAFRLDSIFSGKFVHPTGPCIPMRFSAMFASQLFLLLTILALALLPCHAAILYFPILAAARVRMFTSMEC